MGLAFVPFYIKYLGIEAYGLIGFFALLQSWLSLPDMGMTPTLTREMARYTAGAHTPQSIGDLLRSLEVACLAVAVLIALSIWAGSHWLASDWLKAGTLPLKTVSQAIVMMGVVAAFRFVEGLYRGAIIGLQKQVWFNGVHAVLSTVRATGAVAILAWISPTIEAYFVWQGAVSAGYVAILATATHYGLPRSESPPRLSLSALRGVWRFAGGMTLTTLLALLLTQIDKILLSKLVSLQTFGYYTLAGSIAAVLYQLVAPVTQAFYPRLTELAAKGDTGGLAQTYHRGSQLVTVLTGPIALLLIFFGYDLLALWTGNTILARDVAPLLALLAAGTMLNGLMHIPYMLQLAHGWTGLAVRVNVIAVAVLMPAIYWAATRYGPVGAAWVWVLLNAGYVSVGVHFMYRRLLPGEKWLWYRNDVALPIVAATLLASFFYVAQPPGMGKLAELLWLLVAGICMLGGAFLVTADLRRAVAHAINDRMKAIR